MWLHRRGYREYSGDPIQSSCRASVCKLRAEPRAEPLYVELRVELRAEPRTEPLYAELRAELRTEPRAEPLYAAGGL